MEFSLHKKTLLLIVITVLIITLFSVTYFGSTIRRLQDEQCETRSRELANIVALNIDKEALIDFKSMVQTEYNRADDHVSNDEMGTDEYEEYISRFAYLETTDEYKNLYKDLRNLLEVSDVDCFYLAYLDHRTEAMVYLVDSGDINICHPGSFDYLKGKDREALSNPDMSIVPSVSDPEVYGDIIGSAQPIYDNMNTVIAYVGVDINMNDITAQRNRFLINTMLTIVVLALLLCAASLYLSGQLLLKPINKHKELEEESEKLKNENINLARRARAADKIAELTGSISSLLANMPAMTYSKDVLNGKYIACNHMFAEYAHKSSPSKVIGLRDSEIFDKATVDHIASEDRIALSTDKPYIYHEEVMDANGIKRYLQTTKLKFRDASGRLCLLGMSVDVSELVMVRRENARTKEAYERAVGESLTYSRIAGALSSDYTFLYYINVNTDRFEEYSAAGDTLELEIVRKEDDFFNLALKDAQDLIYEDDRERFCSRFTKDNILKDIEEKGRFVTTYRLMVEGKPVYVSLKAAQVENDDDHIIIGVSNIDNEMRAKEAAERMKDEQITYERITALSGQYICIYTVDPETDHFVEYTATNAYQTLTLPKEGDDFFVRSQAETARVIYEEDRERCIAALNKKRIMAEIEKAGIFSMKYRLMIDGKPRYVRLKATIVNEKDGPQLIVGVSDIDARVRLEQEYATNLENAQIKANYDALTGVRNKQAYEDQEAFIDEKILNDEAVEFAIVVCDINGLKQVNDTLGNEAGDELIQRASSTITNIFRHSLVYRIGGDEFAVFITGDALNDIDKMMQRMENTNYYNKARGGIVIACGMSVYRYGDEKTEQVFERADAAMYRNKQELKDPGESPI